MSIKNIVAVAVVTVLIAIASLSAANISSVERVFENSVNIYDIRLCINPTNGACQSDNENLNLESGDLFLSANLKDAPAGTTISTVWNYLEWDGIEIESTEDIAKSNQESVLKKLKKPSADWPRGKYEVILSVDGSNADQVTKTFEIN